MKYWKYCFAEIKGGGKLQDKQPGLGLQLYACYNFKIQSIGGHVCVHVHTCVRASSMDTRSEMNVE